MRRRPYSISSMTTSSNARVRAYWDAHIHDLEITTHPVGSPGFFADLDAYHFEKLHHLLRLVDFTAWRGRDVLDVGCGAGVEVVRFARGGARVVGVDLRGERRGPDAREPAPAGRPGRRGRRRRRGACPSATPRSISCTPTASCNTRATTASSSASASGCSGPADWRCFRSTTGVSWLHVLSKVMKVPLEHEDAPVLRRYSIAEFRALLGGFSSVEIVTERFPVKSRLHKGWKGTMFNTLFVGHVQRAAAAR